jgi:hypothetical protein
MLPNQRPLGAAAQNHEGDAACSQVLLVANATMGREQLLEAGFLSSDISGGSRPWSRAGMVAR